MVKWLISIAKRVDCLDIKKNLHLTMSGYVSSWLAVFLRGMWKIFCVHLNVWLMMWKLLWQLFFLVSCSTPCLDIVHCFLIKPLVKLCFLNLNAKSECFFMFKFHNNRTCFFALIKSCFYVYKICSLHITFTIYSNLLTAFIKSIFCIN